MVFVNYGQELHSRAPELLISHRWNFIPIEQHLPLPPTQWWHLRNTEMRCFSHSQCVHGSPAGLVEWSLIWQVWGGALESAFLMISEEVLMMLAPGTHWATKSQRILHCPRLKEATLVADIQNQYIQPISHWFQSILGQFLNALNIPCSWRKHLATRKLWILLSVLEAPITTNKYH